MILHRLGLINKNQRGFTLIEMILAIAITGIIVGGITMTIFQVFSVNARSSNHMVAVREVQHAGFEVSRDALMAQNVELDSDGFLLELTWSDWDSGDEHQVVYTLEGTELWRDDGQRSLVAEHINPNQTSCDWDGSVLTFKVTATVGKESETRMYQAMPRPKIEEK